MVSNDISLFLEQLKEATGCNYISDLHEPSLAPALMQALAQLERGRYSLHVWQEAAAYIMGRECRKQSVAQILAELLAHLQADRTQE